MRPFLANFCRAIATAATIAAADFAAGQTPGQPTPATQPRPSVSAPSPVAAAPRIASLRTPGAQSPPDVPLDPGIGQLLTTAFERTQRATTLDDYSSIVDTCEQVLKRPAPEQAVTYAKRLAAWAYNRRGEIYAQQATELLARGDRERSRDLDGLALEDFKAAVAYDPSKWKSIHNRGVSQALHGDLQAAVVDFTAVIQLKPDYANAWFNRGEIRLQLGDYQNALGDYSKSLELNPKDPGALQGRAQAYAKLGQHSQALQDLNAVLTAKPDHASALTDRGEVFAALSQWQQAIDDFQAAVRADSKQGRAHRGLAWLMATCPDERLRNPAGALAIAEKAMEFDGENPNTLDTLAAAYANAQRFDEARSTLEKAIELAPPTHAAEMRARLQLYSTKQPFREIPQAARRDDTILR